MVLAVWSRERENTVDPWIDITRVQANLPPEPTAREELVAVLIRRVRKQCARTPDLYLKDS